MRAMKDSGIAWIGEIPEDWEIKKLKYTFFHSNAGEVIDKSYWNCGSELLYTCQKEPINSNYSGFPEAKRTGINDLLLTRNATPYVFIPETHSIYSNVVQRISLRQEYDRRYIRYSLLSAIDSLVALGDTIPSYNMEIWENITLPIMQQQHRIADYLDRKCSQIDAIIARQQEVIEKLKAYKLSVITEAVTKGLNPDVPMKDSGIPWLGNICNHYALSRVGAFCFVTKLAGFEYTDIMSSAISDTGEVPIVRAQNVRMFNFNDNIDEYIGLDVSQKLDRCTLNKKCLLITFIGAGIGDVCVFSKAMRYHLAPNVAKIEIRDEYKTILDEEYLMFYLGSLAGKGEISKISKASAQPSLSMGTIRGITIAVPPIDEQRKISEYLSRKIAFIDKVVRGKESIIENLLAYKNSLIYEIVTGKKEV